MGYSPWRRRVRGDRATFTLTPHGLPPSHSTQQKAGTPAEGREGKGAPPAAEAARRQPVVLPTQHEEGSSGGSRVLPVSVSFETLAGMPRGPW